MQRAPRMPQQGMFAEPTYHAIGGLRFVNRGWSKGLKWQRSRHRSSPSARPSTKTAKEFQRFQTAHLRREYTERNKLFLSRAVKIKPFATKRLRAVVQIDPPGGARTSDILGKFEKGGIKRPRGGGHIAVPSTLR